MSILNIPLKLALIKIEVSCEYRLYKLHIADIIEPLSMNILTVIVNLIGGIHMVNRLIHLYFKTQWYIREEVKTG